MEICVANLKKVFLAAALAVAIPAGVASRGTAVDFDGEIKQQAPAKFADKGYDVVRISEESLGFSGVIHEAKTCYILKSRADGHETNGCVSKNSLSSLKVSVDPR